jgi:NADP-dependent 3-hydroxy acid dehydrogenase YdfG
MKLPGCSAVVTGGASGLGEATVRAMAAAGVKVAIFDLNRERGETVATAVNGVFCEADVTSDASIEAAFTKAREALGQERILVNCAGRGNTFKTASRSRETGQITQFPIDAFEKVVQINLVGTFRCIAKAAAGMLTLDPLEDGERGVIISTASIAAEDGQTGQAAYASSTGCTRSHGRRHPSEHHTSRHFRHSAIRDRKTRIARCLGGQRAVPEANGPRVGIRKSRARDLPQQLHQRRKFPPGRRTTPRPTLSTREPMPYPALTPPSML